MTTLFNSTFPSYASLARVCVSDPGRYLRQLGAGGVLGFLIKFATIVWNVLDNVTSLGVAVVALKVPNNSGTR
jgi:uncharacterized membrane protein (Fun14 family)